MVEVRLERVSKKFGKVYALKDVSLVFPEARFTALLGPSGSGKTTMLYIIAGIYKPTTGRVYFNGKDVTDLPPNLRNVGLVFQNYALYPHMTVYDNIAFPLRLRRLPKRKIDEKVMEVARLLKIEHLLDRYPSQLSGGQQQRVALARALVKEPSVLLLDEPLSNLDALLRLSIRSELKRLQRDLEITTIYVTHDQAEALSMADQVVVINDGVVQQVAPPEQVYWRPRSIFVATFIGSPPTNILKARITSVEEELVCVEVSKSRYCIREHSIASKIKRLRTSMLVIGFRPEKAKLVKEPLTSTGFHIRAEVYVVETLGRENIVTLLVGNERVKVVTPPSVSPTPGEEVFIIVRDEDLMFFDPDTGLNIEYLS